MSGTVVSAECRRVRRSTGARIRDEETKRVLFRHSCSRDQATASALLLALARKPQLTRQPSLPPCRTRPNL
jgi:hypothetical protein